MSVSPFPAARVILLLLLTVLLCASPAFSQAPRLHMRFDGNLNDASGAGVITSVTAAGFTPSYTADRFGQANRALLFPTGGSASLRLLAASMAGDSNQALGLRSATGNASFTLAAWVYFNSVSNQGYNTVFGNLGTGGAGGILHAGLGQNSAMVHFGFDNNDANGITTAISAATWYHLAFVYDGAAQTQTIYINGIPEHVRTGATNTLAAADLLLGNWGTATHNSNDLRGRLDDVVVYPAPLEAGQVQALLNNVSPTALPPPGTYSAPLLPGVIATAGRWGVREIKATTGTTINGISLGTLVNADRIARAYTAGQANTTIAEYQPTVINMRDPESGSSHNFPNDSAFGTNTTADDNYIVMVGRCAVRITAEDDYTFGFRGDDGSRLRVLGKQFSSSTRLAAGNNINPAHHGDGIYFIQGTGDSHTLGVVRLTPGDYNLELTWWEGSGGASVEVFAARGAKSAFDNTFRLVGDTAAGGLPLAPDPDGITLTANGGASLFVHNNSPSTFTLAWGSQAPPTSMTIDQGVGTVSQTGSTTINTPAQTTTYTLTANYGTTSVIRRATVYVNAAPVISSFTADRPRLIAGQSTRLSWQVQGAASLMLQPGNINVTGQTSHVVSPTANTTYTLTATNPSGSTQRTALVEVGAGAVINSFTVDDPNPPFGAAARLSWNVTNATSLSIDQGVGAVTGPAGAVDVVPFETTTYTLTATNDFGVVTATVQVNQSTPIGVTAAGYSVRRVNSTAPFPFAGKSYLESALSLLDANENKGTETSQSGYTTVNFSDGADGEFIGNSGFPGGGGDNFAIRVTATLVVNTPGEYVLVVNSDDGARLRIDGEDVLVDDSTQTPSSKARKVTLTKPQVPLELIHYDATGGASIELAWIRPDGRWQLLTTIAPAAPIVRGQVLISEFMAENRSTLTDEDGVSSDWIEVWNSTTQPVNLAGYYLTNNATQPNRWAFPIKTLAPNEHLVVFASANDRRNPAAPLHTSFRLPTPGGYLALTRDDGAGGFTTLSEFAPAFPAQNEDISYGSSGGTAAQGYMEHPTPGFQNAAAVLGFVKDTNFSHRRGRYSAPFNLVISTATAGATIRYTTDGSNPTQSNGFIYTGPIPINKTTVIRAAAFIPGWKSTNVDTQTYLFIDDIVTQTTATAVSLGFPDTAVNGQVFRHGMNINNVTAGGGNLQALKNALAAAPSVCMTTEMSDFADPARGYYVNPSRRGLFWERPASIEYINPAGTSEFQIDCGVRVRGGFSRSTSNPKHAFHLYFRGSLYDGDLRYRLFGTEGAPRFDQIDMRTAQNYSWAFQNDSRNTFLREEWSRVTQADMNQPHARLDYFHLYINGIYWGVFNWQERTEADYGASYLGGNKDDFDTVKSAGNAAGYNTEMTDGHFAAWRALFDQSIALKNDRSEAGRTARYLRLQGLNADGTRNLSLPVLLDADNLIDYLLVVFYDGSFDSPLSTFLNNASNNWFGIRDRKGNRGFTFFAHDHEHGMDSTGTNSYNRVGPWGDPNATGNNWGQSWTTTQYRTRETFTKSNPQYIHELLCYSAEYRMRFADRVQRHFFNGGALTREKSIQRLNALAAKVDAIIHAEAARWGSSSLHRGSWLTAKAVVENFINNGGATPGGQVTWPAQQRGGVVIEQLRGYTDNGAKPLFPAATLPAPNYSGPFGGPVANPHGFSISRPGGTGTLYYTVNGGDPRAIGGGVAAGAQTGASPIQVTLNSTATVRARVFNSATGQWSAMTEAEFLVGALASPANLVISKIHYNPPSADDLDEFLELLNISNTPVDLTNVRFTLGVQFQFPTGYLLPAGGRTLVVRDLNAFRTTYPSVPEEQIAGVFTGALDNAGERLQLVDALGAVIRDFSYDDDAPWPVSPDGSGPSLVLKRPETNPDHSLAANWRASAANHGSPGATDAVTYQSWAAANEIEDLLGSGDKDADGLPEIVEYALGTNPRVSSPNAIPAPARLTLVVDGVPGEYLTLTIRRPIGRDDAVPSVLASSDLSSWTNAVPVGAPIAYGDGTETLTFRHPRPTTEEANQFLRLRITRLP